jgi:hypothetical protein
MRPGSSHQFQSTNLIQTFSNFPSADVVAANVKGSSRLQRQEIIQLANFNKLI